MSSAQAMLPQLLPARVDVRARRARRTRHAGRGIVHALRVLGAVRAVAEALAADGAGELLVRFAVHAGAHVRFEQVAVGEGFAADGALEGLLAGVLLAVHVALLLGDEGEAAAGVVALVRFPLGVRVQVAGEFGLGVEDAAVAAAPEAGVVGARADKVGGLHVVVEILGVGEDLVADVCAVVPVAEVFAVGLQCGGTLQATMSAAVCWFVHGGYCACTCTSCSRSERRTLYTAMAKSGS